eukprot:TRINITY_DN22845_c0_g1_i1.p1 TRINITY_DN22845_c0_g1~~TRINITY_DN22845_c0_g1_i1.p1  ORF type:complete len:402 (+),score=-0.39 TRINITY_DN22845_c0_g1_i1:106-1206(+)
MSKPRVIVLGGCGFIGRNLVEYLASNGLVSKIRVADKVLPDLAGLSKSQAQIFKSDLVDFKQANLARDAHVQKVFDSADGKWDIVFNLAAETKFGQTDEVYKENVFDVAVSCANAAAKQNVSRFIHVSTAQVYDAGKKASEEGDKIKPWTKLSKAHFNAEEELKKITGLNVIIIRPAVVYGPGDINGITPRIITASVYQSLGEKMEFLWDANLKINTVHVRDVAASLWHLSANGAVGEVYNLADSAETDQGAINKLLEPIFKIKTTFMGNIKSKLATGIAMSHVAETANEKHLAPWSELCKAKGIINTPLSPYLDEELLYDNALSVNGSKITNTGFSYKHPAPTEELIREVIAYFVELKFFPAGLV